MKKFLAVLIGGIISASNGVAQAQQEGGLVPCQGADCTFNDLIVMVNNIIQFALFGVAVPVTVGVIVWAGIMIMTAGGDVGKVGKAKSMITGTMIGLAIAFGAWLIVETIANLIFGV